MKKQETAEEQGKNLAVSFAQLTLKQMEMFDDILVVYKEAEWSKEVNIGNTTYYYCPLCDQAREKGHRKNCPYFKPNKKVRALEKSREELKDYMETLPKEEERRIKRLYGDVAKGGG